MTHSWRRCPATSLRATVVKPPVVSQTSNHYGDVHSGEQYADAKQAADQRSVNSTLKQLRLTMNT